ncbi:hypothetical protein GGR54DRAFT_378770 [Hypoxylon sp. NC1633]|nr:hypothetical protein GGR54DRAFT_378770 [Hypoxylon sp. NC1633]
MLISGDYMKALKNTSFPDPPRPPTPGPPPRPPPIPPRPPVPTPPPSPSSLEETELLQNAVAKQLSIVAVQLVNLWFAIVAPVSFPYPPRPPTPGPRPGPVGPRPDVPTPPPSPRRSTRGPHYEAEDGNEAFTDGAIDTAQPRQLLYEHLALEPDDCTPPELDPKSPDSNVEADADLQGYLYDNKLTGGLDSRHETGFHTFIHTVVPKDVSDPYTSHLGSYRAIEPRYSVWSLRVGLDYNPDRVHVLSPRKLTKSCPGLSYRALGVILGTSATRIFGFEKDVKSTAELIRRDISQIHQRSAVVLKMSLSGVTRSGYVNLVNRSVRS